MSKDKTATRLKGKADVHMKDAAGKAYVAMVSWDLSRERYGSR